MKRNSYGRLRKVVMAGWFVGVFFFSFFFFLTLSFKLKHSWMFGGKNILFKWVLVLAFWGGGPEQVNHTAFMHMLYADCTHLFSPRPQPLPLGLLCFFPPYFATFL